jgi:hypothetical protein
MIKLSILRTLVKEIQFSIHKMLNVIDKKFDCILCKSPFGLKYCRYNEVVYYDKFTRFHIGIQSKTLDDLIRINVLDFIYCCSIKVII